MAAAHMPLDIEQGASELMRFKFVKDGKSLDISDIEFQGQIKASIYDAVGYPFRFVKHDDYTVDVYMDPDVSASMDFTKGVYDIRMIQVDGFTSRLVGGPVTISLGVL